MNFFNIPFAMDCWLMVRGGNFEVLTVWNFVMSVWECDRKCSKLFGWYAFDMKNNKQASKVIRFLDEYNNIRHGEPTRHITSCTVDQIEMNFLLCLSDSLTSARVLKSNPFESLEVSDEIVDVKKMLVPIDPKKWLYCLHCTKFVGVSIFCIGLNYVKHWEESARKRGVPYPKYPALFMVNCFLRKLYGTSHVNSLIKKVRAQFFLANARETKYI